MRSALKGVIKFHGTPFLQLSEGERIKWTNHQSIHSVVLNVDLSWWGRKRGGWEGGGGVEGGRGRFTDNGRGV